VPFLSLVSAQEAALLREALRRSRTLQTVEFEGTLYPLVKQDADQKVRPRFRTFFELLVDTRIAVWLHCSVVCV
jgi:hypothetical protein